MKKLFILTPAMLLTGMLYSADMSTIKVTIHKGHAPSQSIQIPVNWQTETLGSLAYKIENSAEYKNYGTAPKYKGSDSSMYDAKGMLMPVQYFTWGKNISDSFKSGNIHKVDSTKLSNVIPKNTGFIGASSDNYDDAKHNYDVAKLYHGK